MQQKALEKAVLVFNQKSISSMSRKGNCWDNSVAERFFRQLENRAGILLQLQNQKRCPTGCYRLHRYVLQQHETTFVSGVCQSQRFRGNAAAEVA
jgi:transposase InsO family protein